MIKKKDYGESDEPYTIVVPVYNEEPQLLEQCIKSILKTDNNKKEIFIIDDGSTNNIWKTIIELKELDKDIIKIFRFPKNKGKRYAHELAINKCRFKYLISLDSDTVICKNAIRKLIAPMVSDPLIGATTGNILIKNEKQNLLTRIQAGMYWVGLNTFKRGQSTQGNVVCCSGCNSAYRVKLLKLNLYEYINQTFLGHKCHASEDRYLTNLINEMGYKIIYVKDSLCYTEAPHTLKHFIKQQLRWKRGFIRESLYTITYSWHKSRILFFENIVWMLFPIILILPTIVMAYYLFLNSPLYYLFFLMPSLFVFIICRDINFFLEEPKKAFYYLAFAPLFLFVLYPLTIYAIFLSNPEKWGTRG